MTEPSLRQQPGPRTATDWRPSKLMATTTVAPVRTTRPASSSSAACASPCPIVGGHTPAYRLPMPEWHNGRSLYKSRLCGGTQSEYLCFSPLKPFDYPPGVEQFCTGRPPLLSEARGRDPRAGAEIRPGSRIILLHQHHGSAVHKQRAWRSLKSTPGTKVPGAKTCTGRHRTT